MKKNAHWVDFKQQKVFLGWNSEIKVPVWSGSGKGPLLVYKLPSPSCALTEQREKSSPFLTL